MTASPEYGSRPGVGTDAPTMTMDPGRGGRLPGLAWNAGADLGLLILRLVLGGTFMAHGSQKLFGAFGGSGIDGFARGLASYGFRQTTLLAWVTGLTELVGGGLVVLGLFTPLAAAGLLAIMINTTLLKFGNGFFLSNPMGFELDVVLGGLAAGLVLTGAGRLALDRVVPVFRRPLLSGLPCLAIGVGAALAVHFLLRG